MIYCEYVVNITPLKNKRTHLFIYYFFEFLGYLDTFQNV